MPFTWSRMQFVGDPGALFPGQVTCRRCGGVLPASRAWLEIPPGSRQDALARLPGGFRINAGDRNRIVFESRIGRTEAFTGLIGNLEIALVRQAAPAGPGG